MEQNVISEEDKMYVGYNRIGVRDVGLGITSRYSPDPEAMNCREGGYAGICEIPEPDHIRTAYRVF